MPETRLLLTTVVNNFFAVWEPNRSMCSIQIDSNPVNIVCQSQFIAPDGLDRYFFYIMEATRNTTTVYHFVFFIILNDGTGTRKTQLLPTLGFCTESLQEAVARFEGLRDTYDRMGWYEEFFVGTVLPATDWIRGPDARDVENAWLPMLETMSEKGLPGFGQHAKYLPTLQT